MKRGIAILQTVGILSVWYVAYGTGIFDEMLLGADGFWAKWLISFLPMLIVGLVLGADGFIRDKQQNLTVHKLNICVFLLFTAILVVVPLAVRQHFSWVDEFGSMMAAEVYRKMNISNMFGMGVYAAICLCAGHMLGSFTARDRKYIVLNDGIIIALWFVCYDVLLPMTDRQASGINAVLSAILILLPMLAAGVILKMPLLCRRKSNVSTDKVMFAVFLIFAVSAAVYPIGLILSACGFDVFDGQNIASVVFGFLAGSRCYMVLWLAVGILWTGIYVKEDVKRIIA